MHRRTPVLSYIDMYLSSFTLVEIDSSPSATERGEMVMSGCHPTDLLRVPPLVFCQPVLRAEWKEPAAARIVAEAGGDAGR